MDDKIRRVAFFFSFFPSASLAFVGDFLEGGLETHSQGADIRRYTFYIKISSQVKACCPLGYRTSHSVAIPWSPFKRPKRMHFVNTFGISWRISSINRSFKFFTLIMELQATRGIQLQPLGWPIRQLSVQYCHTTFLHFRKDNFVRWRFSASSLNYYFLL